MKLIQLYVIYLISESNIKEQDASIYAFEFLIFEKWSYTHEVMKIYAFTRKCSSANILYTLASYDSCVDVTAVL
jgi:hypothetical protein